MGQAVKRYCARLRLSASTDREAVATRVMGHFANGSETTDTMLADLALSDATQGRSRR